MTSLTHAQIEPIVTFLREKGLVDLATVVLIGSAARGMTHAQSDIDVLVVLPSRTSFKHLPYEIHAHIWTRTEFLERLQRADDLACWTIRYGKVIADESRWWAKVACCNAYSNIWPDWRQKIKHAARRLRNSVRLSCTGDLDAAWEECALAGSHVARGVLLRAGFFPLSRLELPSQLLEIGFPDLSSAIDRLVPGKPNQRDLSLFTRYVKKLIGYLSKQALGSK